MIAVDLSQTKLELIQWITQTNDPKLLSQLHLIAGIGARGVPFDSLSQEEIDALDQGLEDLKAGRTMDSETMWKRLKEARESFGHLD